MSERRHGLWVMVIPESLDRLLSGMEPQVWRGKAGHYVGMLIGVKHAAKNGAPMNQMHSPSLPETMTARLQSAWGEDYERWPCRNLSARRHHCF